MTLGSLRNEKLGNIFNILIQQPKFLFNKQAEVSVIIDHPAPLQPLRAWGSHSAGEKKSEKLSLGKLGCLFSDGVTPGSAAYNWQGQCPKQSAPEMRCLCWGFMGVQPGVWATSHSIPSLQHQSTASPPSPTGLSHWNAPAPLHSEPRHFSWGADASPAT